MESFPTEAQVILALEQLDRSLALCLQDVISIDAFCDALGEYYWEHALDGHEADAEGRAMLEAYGPRIARYSAINNIVCRICSETDAAREIYIQAGRINAAEALVRLKHFVHGLEDGA